jgi:hypothetical protein
VDAEPLPLLRREALEDTVVELDEAAEELSGGIELEREPRFGEVDLDLVRAALEAASDVCLGLAEQIVDERLPRIALDPVLRVEKAERGGRDDSLFEGPGRGALTLLEVCLRIGPVAERPARQLR